MLVAALTSSPALVAPAVAPLFAKPKLALAPHSDQFIELSSLCKERKKTDNPKIEQSSPRTTQYK